VENEDWFKRVPKQNCPICSYTLNAVVEKGAKIPDIPKEDDLTMCIECYTPLLFNKDLSMRLLNTSEREELDELINEMTNEIAFLKRGKA
jgi:ferredoxin-thioredoxin reductase catalytic subunit